MYTCPWCGRMFNSRTCFGAHITEVDCTELVAVGRDPETGLPLYETKPKEKR